MDSLWLQIDVLWPAMLAGILVVATHVPLGQEVLRRGIIFLDLAIAQIAGLGLIAASSLGMVEHMPVLGQAVAILTAVVASLLLYQLRKHDPREQEALIGVAFVLAATGSILLLASDPHGGERLKDLLVGQILWTNTTQLLWVSIVYVCILFAWFRLSGQGGWLFYPLFAITITLSTQLVGVYLVFASLIIPALAVRRLSGRQALVWAYTVGFSAYLLGLFVSAWKDWPSGATIAWCLAFIGLAACGAVSLLPQVRREGQVCNEIEADAGDHNENESRLST
ncbi:metal ABC transporter permease [Granulosicoccus sp. 3-233]|uniref:metal ABC transporter permease n=1 Tax=Granulosicoccus sp. 3-233 TaxID=3417969 RepID=UPI003D335049